jgi:hypothetical protein
MNSWKKVERSGAAATAQMADSIAELDATRIAITSRYKRKAGALRGAGLRKSDAETESI